MMENKLNKKIVLCADDFGIHPYVNEGILQLIQNKRLSATSCLSLAPYFEQDADALKNVDADIGLHINFTESLGQSGIYHALPKLIALSYLKKLDATLVYEQIKKQFEHFVRIMGKEPDFIDGHQHVHQFPVINQAIARLLSEYQLSQKVYIRNTQVREGAYSQFSTRFKAQIIACLGAKKSHGLFNTQKNQAFLGVYDFTGGPKAYGQLMQQWLISCQSADLIMCHPSAKLNMHDSLGEQRLAEFLWLGSQQFQTQLRDHQVEIVRFAAL